LWWNIPYYKDSLYNEKPDIVSPEGRPVFTDAVEWLYSIGAMKYDISLSEIKGLLEKNKGNFCGIETKLLPIEIQKNRFQIKLNFMGNYLKGIIMLSRYGKIM